MKKTQQGFTLIELMIVVAIIGILAAIAIPAYQDYTIRAKVSEAVLAAAPAKTSISEFFISNDSMPADEAEAGFSPNMDTKYVNSVTLAATTATTATLRVSIKDLGGTTANDQELELFGQENNAAVEWDCRTSGGTPIPAKYLPADCRN